MKAPHTLFLFCCFGLSACPSVGTDEEGADSMNDARAFPPDNDVIAMAYNNSYQVPGYFYTDERADTPGSYSVYHVKDESVSYELCTDDYYAALAWEAADNESRTVQGEYLGSFENDRYFEFVRGLSYPGGIGNISDPTSPGFARVFKCSYVNRDGADRNLRDGYAGIMNMRPLTQDAIRIYSEYMWQFTFFWPARKTVLETFSAEEGNEYKHTLVLAFLTNQGWDRCDLIEVVDWVFTIDKSDGKITKEFKLLYQMETQVINGVPVKCDT